MQISTKNNNYMTSAIALTVTLAAVILGIFFPEQLQLFTRNIRTYISHTFGWYYLLLVTIIVIFCLFMIFSPIGQIRLGDPGSKPEYSKGSWLAMLFSAGMGIGLIFFGAAEPLSHYAIYAPTATECSAPAFRDALKFTFFHWGIHAWAVYAIVSLALAYFKFRKKESSLLSMTLKPLFGDAMYGPAGKIVDSFSIFATVAGVATTLGFGAAQINGGISFLFGIPISFKIQVIIIAITTFCFILSAMSGIGKGVRILSNLNSILAISLLLIVLTIGPTVLIMNTFVDTIGNYLQSFFQISFRTAMLDPKHHVWIEQWTIMYWAWWIAWSPFVGVFIARISKGRTIREFLTHVLLIPTVLSFLWFTTFGVLAIETHEKVQELTNFPVETTLFATFSQQPLSLLLSLIAIILVFSFFITSADSATFVLGMMSENGTLQPSQRNKLVWGVLLSSIAVILMYAGGLTALQDMLIIVALPFSLIIILMMISLYIELRHEKQEMGLYIKPDNYPEKGEPFKSYE